MNFTLWFCLLTPGSFSSLISNNFIRQIYHVKLVENFEFMCRTINNVYAVKFNFNETKVLHLDEKKSRIKIQMMSIAGMEAAPQQSAGTANSPILKLKRGLMLMLLTHHLVFKII